MTSSVSSSMSKSSIFNRSVSLEPPRPSGGVEKERWNLERQPVLALFAELVLTILIDNPRKREWLVLRSAGSDDLYASSLCLRRLDECVVFCISRRFWRW